MSSRKIRTKTVPIEAIDDAFSVATPTIVLKDDEASQVLLNAFGEMIAIYRKALYEAAQAGHKEAMKAIQKAGSVEKAAIAISTRLINAEKARNSKKASVK